MICSPIGLVPVVLARGKVLVVCAMATLNYIVSCLALLGIVGFTNGLALNNQFLNSPNRLNKGSNGLGSSTTTASSNGFRLKVQFMNGQESQGDNLFGAGVDYYLDRMGLRLTSL